MTSTSDEVGHTASKQCSRCKEINPISLFSKSRRAKDGLQTCCKPCQSEKQKADPEGRRARNRRHYARRPGEYAFKTISARAKKNSIPLGEKGEFLDWYYSTPLACAYCGVSQADAKAIYAHSLHIDRMDISLGYVTGNVCFACQRCNLVKSAYLTHQQMKEVASSYFNSKASEQVNSHDSLVKALEEAVNDIRGGALDPDDFPWMREAVAALSQAKGGK